MATLALSAAGSAIGGAVLPGFSALGGAVTGATLGNALGAVAGTLIDQALFAPSGQQRVVEGSRLSDLKVTSSTEGASIPRVYGRARMPGQMIWATHFEEKVVKTASQQSSGGGKGLSGGPIGGSSQSSVTQIEYRYFANVAYAVCEGEITRIGRIWADGKELNQSDFTIRVYRGSEDQDPDSLIQAKEGTSKAPAYRGTAYIVFERMPLGRFGNRLPQFNFEVFRAVDSFEKTVRAITIIPGTGEFVYDTQEVSRDAGGGATATENLHSAQGGTDWTVGIDQLQDAFPNVANASLFVSWFGSDLRAGHCDFRPGVEIADKVTVPKTWRAGGIGRAQAHLVSRHAGRPAYGGTPADSSVVNAIRDMKDRGIAVTFCPFVLMDIEQDNGLPDPWTGAPDQPAYPWRGRITVDPAPGQAETPDKTEAAAGQIATLVGAARPEDFSVSGASVSYTGAAEWSYRRMVLHYAHLCAAAGGVDSFLIGSELKGLTQVRESDSSYPFVDALVRLAADVKGILGSGTKVSYAADWSEYFGHQPGDGSGDVYFNLDPLWASQDIDAIAIDNYWPLADWRDGDGHLDRLAGVGSIYEPDYLRGNIAGGEGFDWYYASDADRAAQTRTPITDGIGKPWIFRFKDIKGWWRNTHHNRPGGVEAETPTEWVPESKPFWFTEIGCPAVDKGANQPNVFIDPKSGETRAPHFSRGTRDDLIQRRYIDAFHQYFDPASATYASGANPSSSIYTGRMVDTGRLYVYTWDARPYPAYPLSLGVWSDGGNWEFGHWLTGRAAGGPLPGVVEAILGDYGFERFSVAGLAGHLDGYVIDRIMSVREVLQTLELAFFFDSFESGGLIRFAHRGRDGVLLELAPDDLCDATGSGAPPVELYQVTRSQETELPASAKLTYVDGNADYRQAAVEARRLAVQSERVATANLPVVMAQSQAQAMAESWLQDAWTARERASLSLPPSMLALEPTDIVALQAGAQTIPLRITRSTDGVQKAVEARSIEPDVFAPLRAPTRSAPQAEPGVFGQSVACFLDLPLLRGDESPHAGYLAAYQFPWPGAVAFYRSPGETGFALNRLVTAPATLGVTTTGLRPGPTSRYDLANRITVELYSGELESATELALLGGANAAAIENADGAWEIIQFRDAELIAPRTYVLSALLRGQAGTEGAMRNPVASGARFLLLDSAVVQADMTADEIALAFNWKYGPVSRDIAHDAYQDRSRAFSGLGLKPLSPVHVRGRVAAGDLEVTWIRRTRSGGDNWELPQVPLGEALEGYEVDILDGDMVKRTIATSEPRALYTAAEQASDWGEPQPAYTVSIHQMSAAIGRGHPKRVTINV